MSTQSTKLVLVASVAIAIGLVAQGFLVAEQTVQGQTTTRLAQPQVLDFDKLTEQQFKQLPDSQLIMFDGKQITLGELRAKAKAQEQRMTQQQATRTKMVQAPNKARLAIDQLLRTQQQKFAAENAKVQTELKRLRQFGPATVHGQTTNKVGVATQKQKGLERLPPQITKVFGMIEPGGLVLIGGNFFGGTRGRVRLIVPNMSYELLLENLEWYPTGIGGRIPNNPALVKGTGFRFVVETSAGAKSNEWPVNWIIEVKLLPHEDVRVVSCGDDASKNICIESSNGFCGFYHSWVNIYEQKATASLWATHVNCGTLGDDTDTDYYEIKLKNGWVLQEYEFGYAISGQDEGWARPPLAFAGAFPRGATYWKPFFEWSVTPKDQVGYWSYIYIAGPKGVPHK